MKDRPIYSVELPSQLFLHNGITKEEASYLEQSSRVGLNDLLFLRLLKIGSSSNPKSRINNLLRSYCKYFSAHSSSYYLIDTTEIPGHYRKCIGDPVEYLRNTSKVYRSYSDEVDDIFNRKDRLKLELMIHKNINPVLRLNNGTGEYYFMNKFLSDVIYDVLSYNENISLISSISNELVDSNSEIIKNTFEVAEEIDLSIDSIAYHDGYRGKNNITSLRPALKLYKSDYSMIRDLLLNVIFQTQINEDEVNYLIDRKDLSSKSKIKDFILDIVMSNRFSFFKLKCNVK